MCLLRGSDVNATIESVCLQSRELLLSKALDVPRNSLQTLAGWSEVSTLIDINTMIPCSMLSY